MLERLYSISHSRAKALDFIFDIYWHLYDKYEIMNEILDKVDISKLDGSLLCGFMSQTFKYSEQVPNHIEFCRKSEIRLKELNYSEKEINEIMHMYSNAGDYWKN